MSRLVKKEYALPFILVTSLFFLWGFARAIMDVLNKHFQSEMDISISQSTWVQGVFFLGYFLLAIPAGLFINKFGYRKGVVFGLLLFGFGSLLFGFGSVVFEASARLSLFRFFLFSLFVIACGLVFLETAANPYMTRLGDKETAASRLNLAQSFNGLGNICGPFLGGIILFSGSSSSISTPYIGMGLVVFIVALTFSKVRLPEITEDETAGRLSSIGSHSLLRNRRFMFGFIALLFYEIAEISINSLFINYAEKVRLIDNLTAAKLLSLGFLLFMCARFVGSWVMMRLSAERVLLYCSIGTLVATSLVLFNLGEISLYALLANYVFEAIMFPTIFSIALKGLGEETKRAASYLMLSTIGGAIGTMLMGFLADRLNLSVAFIVPLIGYFVILFYSWSVNRVISGQAPNRKGSPT